MSYLSNRAPQVTTSLLMEWLTPTYAVEKVSTLPSSGNNMDLVLLTSVNPNVYYQYDNTVAPPNGPWINLGPVGSFNLGNLPTGQGPIELYDQRSQNFANLFVVYQTDNNYISGDPLLVTDVGFWVKKDLAVGGEILSEQGLLVLGSGWTTSIYQGVTIAQSPPLIELMFSTTPIPSGSSLPSASELKSQPGQVFNYTPSIGPKTLYIWTGPLGTPANNWNVSEITDFSGYYDTLFLVMSDACSPANLDLGKLICHSAVEPYSDNTSSVGTSTNMFQNMYTRSLIIGNNSLTPSEYLTFSIDSTGVNLVMTSSQSYGSITPMQNKTLNLGSSSNPWSNIYCQSLATSSISTSGNIMVGGNLGVVGSITTTGPIVYLNASNSQPIIDFNNSTGGNLFWLGYNGSAVYLNCSSLPLSIVSSSLSLSTGGNMTLMGQLILSGESIQFPGTSGNAYLYTGQGTSNYALRLNLGDANTIIEAQSSSGSLFLNYDHGSTIYFGNGGSAGNLNNSGNLTLAGNLYLTGNTNGYLWNNGGYIRQSGGYGFVADGYVVVGTISSGSNGPLYLDSNHRISYYSSSQRYKQNIETLTDCSWIYNLRPVTFDWKDQSRAKSEGQQIGLIAEEVRAICPQLAWLNDTDQPEGVHYEWLGIPLIVEMQKLKQRVDELENQLTQN